MTSKPSTLSLLQSCTAFRRLSELIQAMQSGYIPTLAYCEADQRQLGERIEAEGYAVYWIMRNANQEPEADVDTLVEVVKCLGETMSNLVPLTTIRTVLSYVPRNELDSLIHEARKAGLISAAGLEGRHGVSQAEREAAIQEDGETLGYLMLRAS